MRRGGGTPRKQIKHKNTGSGILCRFCTSTVLYMCTKHSTTSVPHAHTSSSPSSQSLKLTSPPIPITPPPSCAANCSFWDPRHPETKTVGVGRNKEGNYNSVQDTKQNAEYMRDMGLAIRRVGGRVVVGQIRVPTSCRTRHVRRS